MGYPVSLQDRAEDAYENSKGHGFWDGVDIRRPEVMAAKLCLIHSEVSEALEAARLNEFEEFTAPVTGKPEGMISELADIVIRVFDLAEAMREKGMTKLTIEQAIRNKMLFNEARPHMHGKTI